VEGEAGGDGRRCGEWNGGKLRVEGEAGGDKETVWRMVRRRCE
jgi:hypothetical protein